MTETRMKEESNEREGEMRQRNRSRPRLIPYTAAVVPNNRVISTVTQNQVPLIPKPRGSAGDGYCLIEEMGLVDDKLTYNAIVVCDPDFSIFSHMATYK